MNKLDAPVALYTGLLLAVFPWCAGLYHSVSPHDSARMLQLGLLALAGVAVCWTRVPRAAPGGAGLVLLTLAALGGLSCLSAEQPMWALQDYALTVAVILFGRFWAIRSWEANKRLAYLLSLGWSLYPLAVAALLLVLARIDPGALRVDLLPGFSNPRFFNDVQAVTVPLAIWASTVSSRRWLRYWLVASAAAHVALLLFTGGRSALLALLVSLLLAAVWAPALWRRWRVAALAALLLGVSLYAVTLWPVQQVANAGKAESMSARMSNQSTAAVRMQLWAAAWDDALEHPLLGAGPMHFARHAELRSTHPHNLPLQFAAEWGLPAASLALGLAACGWVRFAYRVRGLGRGTPPLAPGENHAVTGVLLLAALTAAGVNSLFAGHMVMPLSQMWTAVLAGMAISWWSKFTVPSACRTGEIRSGLTVGMERCAAMATILLAAIGLYQARGLDLHLEAVQAASDLDRRLRMDPPRFWSNGRIGVAKDGFTGAQPPEGASR